MKPKRIVHVTNFGYRPVKVYLHNTGMKLSNGWIRAGHHVINFSDRDIAKWKGFLGIRDWGIKSTNKILIKLCENIQPDVLVFGHADIIDRETIFKIKELFPNIKVIQWNVDWVVPRSHTSVNEPSSENNRNRILAKQDITDATFITTGGDSLKELSTPCHPVCFLPNPVDHSIETARNFERKDLPFDIFFASNSADDRRYHCGDWREMGRFVHDMLKAIPSLTPSLHGLNDYPKVFGPAYQAAISNCTIGLNISRRNDVYMYSSDRLAHLIGNGLTTFMERSSGYGDLFSDDEMVFYSSEDELFEKIRELKSDDAKRRFIGKAGWERYSELFNSTVIAQYMLDVVFGEVEPSSILNLRKNK